MGNVYLKSHSQTKKSNISLFYNNQKSYKVIIQSLIIMNNRKEYYKNYWLKRTDKNTEEYKQKNRNSNIKHYYKNKDKLLEERKQKYQYNKYMDNLNRILIQSEI